MAHGRIDLAVDDFVDMDKWHAILVQLGIDEKQREFADSIQITAKLKELYLTEDPDAN